MEDAHPDAYQCLAAPSAAEFKDRGSRFLAFAAPCPNEAGLRMHLAELQSPHRGANHHCYAAVFDDRRTRSSDDGEPAGTAGQPILNALLGAELVASSVVVVRYFGGTKLGKHGLITAYRAAAREALDGATIATRYATVTVCYEFGYPDTGEVLRAIEAIPHARVLDTEYLERCTVRAAIPQSEVEHALAGFAHRVAITATLQTSDRTG